MCQSLGLSCAHYVPVLGLDPGMKDDGHDNRDVFIHLKNGPF